jgi:sugar phosphate isomerase/epimerase
VKDQVHAPDWTSDERVAYTIRMFQLLSRLLPNHLTEGGISTSPLSYRFWWKDETALTQAIQTATQNMLTVVDELLLIAEDTGKILHLDIEPEPDGILENSGEFIDWYQNTLIPMAIEHFAQKSISEEKTIEIIHTHIQLCYDICHFGVSYEEPQPAIDKLNELGIKVGKIQISSAIKVDFTSDAAAKLQAIVQYDEPTYLHQVVALRTDGKFDMENIPSGEYIFMCLYSWKLTDY